MTKENTTSGHTQKKRKKTKENKRKERKGEQKWPLLPHVEL